MDCTCPITPLVPHSAPYELCYLGHVTLDLSKRRFLVCSQGNYNHLNLKRCAIAWKVQRMLPNASSICDLSLAWHRGPWRRAGAHCIGSSFQYQCQLSNEWPSCQGWWMRIDFQLTRPKGPCGRCHSFLPFCVHSLLTGISPLQTLLPATFV